MIWLLMGLAFAQDTAEPQKFNPVPVEVTVDGAELSGILIDEDTAAELALLRKEVHALRLEVEAHEYHDAAKTDIMAATMQALKDQHAESLTGVQSYYRTRLQEAEKRTFLERNGVEAGIVIGVASTVAIVFVTGKAIGSTAP